MSSETRLPFRKLRSSSVPFGGAALVAGALLFGGCAAAPQARFSAARTVLNQLEEQTACSRAVQGDAKLMVSGPFLKVHGNLLYRAEVPEKLRFDVYSPLGVTLSTLTSDGSKFALYDLSQKTFVYGPARTCNIRRFTQVAVPPFALVELLRGRPPVLAHEPIDATLRFARPLFGDGFYEVRIEGQRESTETIVVEVARQDYERPLDQQRLRLRRVRVEQQGTLLYEVKLEDYRSRRRALVEQTQEEKELGVFPPPPTGPPCSAELPSRLSFSVGRRGYRLSVLNQDVVHNPASAASVYTQPIPEGVHTVFSDCR